MADVADELGLDLTHPQVDTVSGLVLFVLDSPPLPGAVVTWREGAVRLAPAGEAPKLTPRLNASWRQGLGQAVVIVACS